MTARPRLHRRSSWLLGALVLGGLAWTLWTLWSAAQRLDARMPPVPQDPAAKSPTVEAPAAAAATASARPIVRRLQGVVRGPGGTPVAGATVAVFRALTAAPEWLRESLEIQAITGPDGEFVFELPERHGLLIQCRHRLHPECLVAVPEVSDRLVLDLVEGFELSGLVTNDFGGPVGGVRVAAEAIGNPGRPVEIATSSPNSGGYRFDRLPAGLVRLVARHEQWQAVSEQVLVGDVREANLKFTTPALPPMRGRVVTAGQVPVQGAVVEVLPTSGRLGLVDPLRVQSDASGEFSVGGLSRGPMALIARHPDFGTVRHTITFGTGVAGVVLEMTPRSAVSGFLTIDNGGEEIDVAGAALQLTDGAGELHHTVVGADGSFAFAHPIVPGRATLHAFGGGFAFARSQAFDVPLQVEDVPRTVVELAVGVPTIVQGRCVDDNGRPLAGVEVRGARPLTASRLIGNELASRLGAGGLEMAMSLGEAEDLLAVSGDDGTFEFRGWQPGPLQLRCTAPRRAERAFRFVVPPPGEPGRIADVAMQPGGRIEGIVSRGRRALAGVPVSIVGDEVQTTVVTQAGGRFVARDLPAGGYRVRARLPSMPTGQDEQRVTVVPGASPPRVSLQLPSGRPVRGVVTGRDGQPVANATVAVRGAGGQPAVTDAEGRFLLELAPRTVELQVAYGEAGMPRIYQVRPGQDEVELVYDVEPTGTIVAAIAGLPGQKRIPGVLLRLLRQGQNGNAELVRWVEVQNGTVRWPLAPVGRQRIEIWCEGYMPHFVERDVEPNVEADLGEIRLEPGATARGRVVDKDGRPVANARVMVGDESCIEVLEPEVRTAADGTFVVTGVSTRCPTVTARAAGFAPGTRELVLPRDVLGPDEVRIVLQPGSAIVVTAQNAPDAAIVRLLAGGRVLASAVLDETGRAEFVDRGPGDYAVVLQGGNDAGVPVRVDAPGTTVRARL